LSFSFNSPAVLRKHPWQFRRPTHHWSRMTRLGPNDDIRLPPRQPPSTHSPRRNNFTVPSPNDTRAGGQSMGEITMTDTESGNERRLQVERYRVLKRETTEPLAALLLHDIVLTIGS
jgi:hypothetical protein